MKIAIIQLSDIHLKANGPNAVLGRKDQILAAAKVACTGADACILVVSGDIAFSGKKEEYALGLQLLSGIKAGLQDKLQLPSLHTVIVPGNHDCDFSSENSVRTMILDGIAEHKIDDPIVSLCSGVQDEYFTFLNTYDAAGGLSPRFVKERLYKAVQLRLGDREIIFHLLNSAWMSRLHEDPGKMILPIGYVKETMAEAPQTDLSIGIIHHPFNWNDPDNSRALRTLLEDNCDVIMTGHEHVAANYTRTTDWKLHNHYLEGGALQDSYNADHSAFNVVIFDLDKRQQKTNRLKHNGELYANEGNSEWRAFDRNSRLTKSLFTFTDQFSQFLDDPGTGFIHPAKDRLRLSDFYVHPDFREATYEKEPEDRRHLAGAGSIAEFINDKRVIIVGDEKSGKTSFAKVLVHSLHERSIIPVFLEASQLSKCHDEQRLNRVIELALEEQYGKGVDVRYWQLDEQCRSVVVDDFHQLSNSKFRSLIANMLSQRFGVVTLLSGDRLNIETVLATSDEQTDIWTYEQWKLLPFGHVLRRELITKWHRIGQEFTLEEADLRHKIDQTSRQISTVLKIDFVPSIPVFVLTLLQQLETSAKPTTNSGSFGYLYEVLVTATLLRARSSEIDLDWKYNYLSELAYHLFNEDNRAIEVAAALKWHGEYCKSYTINIDFSKLWADLIDAFVIEQRHGEYRFRYKYLYYFFVARYMRDHINDQEVQEMMATLCRKLHEDEYSNIIVFLCHLSKDESVLNAILTAAQGIHTDLAAFDVCDNDKWGSDLDEALPILPTGDAEHHHREALKEQDESDRRELAKREANDVTTDDSAKTPAMMAYLAAKKTVEILGQVLRNFSGSLRAEPKQRLVEHCFGLGLRLLTDVSDSLDSEKFHAFLKMVYAPEDDSPKEEKRCEIKVDSVIYNMRLAFAFGIIKHISSSVGSEKVSQTLDEVIKANKNGTVALIDLSVRLDHYKDFPEREIERLLKKFKGYFAATTLMRYMVWNHLYLFPVEFKQKQRICAQLEIRTEHQTKLLTSPEKQHDRPRHSSGSKGKKKSRS